MHNKKVLVVANTGTERALINLVTEDFVATTVSAMTGAEAKSLLEIHRFDLVIVESPTVDESQGVTAEEVAAAAKVVNPNAFVLALVSAPDYQRLQSQNDSIAKPFSADKLRSTIKWALSTTYT